MKVGRGGAKQIENVDERVRSDAIMPVLFQFRRCQTKNKISMRGFKKFLKLCFPPMITSIAVILMENL